MQVTVYPELRNVISYKQEGKKYHLYLQWVHYMMAIFLSFDLQKHSDVVLVSIYVNPKQLLQMKTLQLIRVR